MLSIRLARSDDADAISRLTSTIQELHSKELPEIFKPHPGNLFSTEKLAGLLEDEKAVVAVAELKGEIVGHLYASVVSRAENEFRRAESWMYIHQIGVRDGFRRQGVGRALVAFLDKAANASGITKIQADHFAFNTPARSFFDACGFSPLQVSMRRNVGPPG